MPSANEFLGFDLTQVKTLQNLGLGQEGELDLQAQIDTLTTNLAAAVAINTAQATSIANLNAWATALATKLNADAGVTDTDYDTNPQA